MAVSGRQWGAAAVVELWGVLLPPRREAAAGGSEEETEDEAEEEPHLAEAALLEASGPELEAALPPRRAVVIQEEESKKEYEVVGRFPLVDPWWKVNVKAKKMGSKYFVQGYPSYFLRTDIEENNRQVFSLFLKECTVPEDFKEKFFTWLPMESMLSFRNLEEKLREFQVSQLQTGKKQRDTKHYDIFYYVSESFAGKAVLVALTFPRILEYLPILLPRHFCCLLNMVCWQRKTEENDGTDGEEVHCQDKILTTLDEILKNEPWKLGFSRMEKEVEAASKDFEEDLDASEEWNTFDHHGESENMYTKKFLNVLFTAPTGRAASLLSEKTKLPAYTLHQIIYSFKSWRQSEQVQPWKFSTVTILIVDEGSLVSVHVLSLVLKLLCEHAELAKLIILGDTRQLPSIDPGNMLADIFEGLKSRGFSVELRTNHRAESQLIVDNASRISRRKLPEFDEVLKVSDWNEEMSMPSPEKKFILIALPAGGGCDSLQIAIKTLLKKGPGLQDAKQSQFIAFRRQDCDLINELCCQHYSNHVTRDHKNRLLFQIDDKISCMRNTYLKDLLPDCGFGEHPNRHECRSGETTLTTETAEEGKRLCNGDIFFITGDVEIDKQRLLTISSTYGSTFTVKYKALKKLCHIKHAWARTIHTFQGSEIKTVVYVVGNPGRQHWQHVYTAVTRGRCRVYVIAEEMHLRRAVTNRNMPRKTCLQRFLREAIAETSNCPTQPSSPPTKSWQSQELETGAVSVTQGAPAPSEPLADSMKQEGSAVLNTEEETGNLQRSPCKRQQTLVENSKDAMKKPSTTVKDSPLGSSRLQNLTLGQPTPRKLFRN
ncbi:DNA helicase B isoform 3-T3 [Theristicus caerulescens]